MSPAGRCNWQHPSRLRDDAHNLEALPTCHLYMLRESLPQTDLDAALAQYTREGYARLGISLSQAGLVTLRAACDSILSGELRYDGMFFQHDSPTGRYEDLSYAKGWIGPSVAYRKIERLELDPTFRAWIENPLFARLANQVLGDDVTLYRALLWNKEARAGTLLPWHQDDGKFWGINRRPQLQTWTALDDVSEDGGCLEVVPGTHLGGLASAEGGTIQQTALEAADAERRRIKLPARAGEVFVLHNHLWHRSGLNNAATPRRAISVSFLHGATRCLRTRRAPRTFLRLFENHPLMTSDA